MPFARRAAAGILFLLLTVLLGAYARSLRVDPGVESVLPSQGKDLEALRSFNRVFGSDETIVLAISSHRLFTSDSLRAIDRLTTRLGRLPHVGRVLSPTNARDLEGDELGPFVVVPYQQVAAGKLSAQAFGRQLAAHPIFGGLLVSADTRTAALLLEVKGSESDADYRKDLVRRVRHAAATAGGDFVTHVAGIPVEKVDVAAYVRREQRIFTPLILGMLVLVMAILYRHPVGVVVPLTVVVTSLIWTLGLFAAAGRTLNPVTSLITPVILVVSVAECIHLMNHHLAARAEGLSVAGSLERARDRSRAPCFNAALTTAIGFGSLLVLPIPAIREFGVFSALGVLIAYLLTMTLAPLLLASLPDLPEKVTRHFATGRLEQGLRRATGIVCRHPLPAALGTLLLLALSLLGIARIRVETDLIRSLRPETPLARATRFIDGHLTGVNSLEILVPGAPADDPEALRRVARFEAELRTLPGIRKITGYPDLVARVHRAWHAGDDAYATLPEGAEAQESLIEIRDLLHEESPADLARFVSPDGGMLRLAARVPALDTGSSQRLFRDVRSAAGRSGLTGVSLTGNFVVLSDMSTSLVSNQVRGLVPAFAMILLAMAVQFRSVRLGLLGALPGGAPVLMTYGLMGWAGIRLSVPTAMIAGIAVGMTVDNTIHLLAHFRDAFRKENDYETALEAMMDSSGRAVVYSTLIVAAGFLVGAFSSFLPSVHFAVLTATALILGLGCAVVLLPLSLILFQPLGRISQREASVRPGIAGVLLLALLPLGPAPSAAEPGTPPILLKDQFGRSDGPGRHSGRTVILLYGRPPDLRRMKSWEQKLRENGGSDFDVLRAVDARGVRGRKTEPEVNERLRQGVPAEIAILVDWNGDLARAYGLPDSAVAVTVLDARGTVCQVQSGPVRDESLRELLAILKRVRERGTCP